MALGNAKIKALRESLGLTQLAAGEAFGIAKGAAAKVRWFQIESGLKPNPSLETIEGICRVLGVGIDQILADDSPAMPRPSRRRRTPEPQLLPDTWSEEQFEQLMKTLKYRRLADKIVAANQKRT